MLDNGIESEWIGSTHGGEQIRLAGLPQLRQQGLPAAIAPELRQLLADAKNNIDRRRLPPLLALAKIPRSKIHRSKLQIRIVIFPSTILSIVTSFHCLLLLASAVN
jgi:hypothetical protein